MIRRGLLVFNVAWKLTWSYYSSDSYSNGLGESSFRSRSATSYFKTSGQCLGYVHGSMYDIATKLFPCSLARAMPNLLDVFHLARMQI